MPRIKNYRILIIFPLSIFLFFGLFFLENYTSKDIDAYDISDDFNDDTYIDIGNSSNYLLSGGQITASTKSYTFGTGADGACTVSSNMNINTQSCVGRPYGDAVRFYKKAAYNANAGDYILDINTSTTNGLAIGDEVLILIQDGLASASANTGKYETAIISNITADRLTFETPLQNSYTSSNNVAVIRVPQYTNVTVNEGVTVTADTKSLLAPAGVVFFKASGTVTINGSISTNAKGFPGAAKCFSNCGIMGGARGADYAKGSASHAGNINYSSENGENEEYSGGGGGGGMYLTLASVDSYANTNYVSTNFDVYGANGKQGQSFTGNGGVLDSIKLYIRKSGSPTGSAYAKVYSHSGTYGTSSVPDTLLATSEAFDVSLLTTTISLASFNFIGDQRITLSNGSYYVVVLEYTGGNSSNKVLMGADSTTPTHGGNKVSHDGSNWIADSAYDFIFYAYSDNGPVTCGVGGTGGIGGAGGGGGSSSGNTAARSKGGGGGGGGYGTGGDGGVGYNNGVTGSDDSGNGGNAYCSSSTGEAYAGGGGGGGIYGIADLSLLYLGSGGGAGGSGYATSTTDGGTGGGIVYIYAQSVSIGTNGSVTSNGGNGTNAGTYSGGAGGGSGGSVKILSNSVSLGDGKVTATGGTGGTGAYNGGNGGNGRIRIDYVSSISGSTTPSASTSQLPQYQDQASIQSTDILPGDDNMNIISFDYSISSLPSGTAATAKFSTDGTTWYNSEGVEDDTDTLTEGDSNSIDLSSLSWDTDSFYYRIEFSTNSGASTPILDNISLIYDQIPIAPTTGTSESLSHSSIRWNFADNSDNELGFKMYDEENSLISTVQIPNLNYIDETDLSPNTQYTRKFVSYNILGNSNYSDEVSNYTYAQIPTISFGSIGKNSIQLTATNTNNLSSGTSGILFNCTSASCNTGINNWIKDTSAVSSSLSPNTQYSYRVKARNADSVETEYSSIISKYTLSETPILSAVAFTTTSITLHVANTSNLTNVSSGLLFSCSSSNCNIGINEWIQVNTDTSTNLLPNTQYSYTAKSRNAEAVETTNSNILTRYTLANTPSISCPSSTSSSITLSLDKNSNPESTNILIIESNNNKYLDKTTGQLSSNSSWGSFQEFSNNGSYTVKSLNPSTEYIFKVKAKNGDELETAYSNSITCYTKATVNQPVTPPPSSTQPTIPTTTEEPVQKDEPQKETPKITEEEKTLVLNIIKDDKAPVPTVKETDKVIVDIGKKEITVKEKTKVSIYANNTLDIGIPMDTISSLNPNASVSGVYIESKGEILKLGLDATSSFYKTRMDIFNSLGTYDLNILAMFDDNTTARMKLEVLVDPYGFVYEDVKGQELRLSNAKVTLYSKLDNKWNIYGTGNNPQFTNKHGEYQFMVEPGTYKIEVELDGYDKYESEEIEVEKTTIEKNIQLQKKKIGYLKYAYILGGIFLLIAIIVLSRKKK